MTDSTVSAANNFVNSGELHLAGTTSLVSATNFSNSGLVAGSGRVNGIVSNLAAGQMRVADNERMEVIATSGTNQNNGLIDVGGRHH